MDSRSQRVKVKVGGTVEAVEGQLFISVPSTRIAEYGNPETKVDLIIGAVGQENQETTLRVGQRVEYNSPTIGLYEIRLLSSESPIELLVTRLGDYVEPEEEDEKTEDS